MLIEYILLIDCKMPAKCNNQIKISISLGVTHMIQNSRQRQIQNIYIAQELHDIFCIFLQQHIVKEWSGYPFYSQKYLATPLIYMASQHISNLLNLHLNSHIQVWVSAKRPIQLDLSKSIVYNSDQPLNMLKHQKMYF